MDGSKRNSRKPGTHAAPMPRRTALMMALEPRVMFDGAVVATLVQAHPHPASPEAVHAEGGDHLALPHAPAALGTHARLAIDDPAAPVRNVLFVDARIEDAQSLLSGLAPGTEVVFLQQGRSGLQQMLDYLDQHPGASSVQILAHGNDGDLWLGNTYLSADNIGQYANALARIGADIKSGGDILVYACDTAAGDRGMSFVTSLAELTHRDVAASSDRMGAGYDWNLEVHVGDIGAAPVLSATAEAGYTHDLAIITVTSNADSGAGTLRNAIASATAGDTITFSGSMTVTLSTGQLAIGKNLTIDGDLDNNGTPDVIIDANYTSRVISVSAGTTVTLDGLVIEHGLAVGNGGNISTGGGAAMGGGISNAGTLTLRDVTVTANAAAGGGGGGGISYSVGGGGGGGGGAIGGGFGGKGGDAGTTGSYLGVAGSPNQGGRGGSYDGVNLAGMGGGSSGGAGGNAGASSYMTGGNGGTASNGTLSIGGGGGGAGFTATGGAGGAAVGGIYNTGTLTIIGTSVIANNLGAGGGGGGGGGGGATYAFNGGAGGRGVGAIWNQGGTVQITASNYSAMTGNAGGSGAGGASSGGTPGSTPSASAKIFNNGGTLNTNYDNPPVVSNLNGDSASYVEGGSAVFIDSGSDATVTDSDNANFSGGNVTVSIVANRVSGEDVLGIANQGTGAGQIGISGSNVTYGGVTIGTFSGGSGTNDLVISLNASATPAATQALIHALTYIDTNGSDPSTAARTVRVTVNDGAGGTSTASDVTVSVTGVNDAPTLSATATNPIYTENGSAVDLFSGVSVSTVEAGQTITQLSLTVGNLHDGASEILTIDGTDVALTNGNAVTTATNGMNVTVSVSGGTATVVIAKAAGISSSAANTLADGIAYRDTSDNPDTTARVVTITGIKDSGGTANGGVDTTTTAIASTVSMVAVNDAPIVTSSGGTTSATEQVATVVDGGITVSDVDNTTLASATVSITGNFHSGEDVLAFINDGSTMGNIAASYNAATGVLTLTSAGGTATLAQWQAALRAVTYTDTSDAPNTATRTISFVANDGTDSSVAATKSASVAPVNDAPVVTSSGGTTSATEQVATVVDGGITVSDVDNTTLASATVSITGNFHSGEDVLAFINTSTVIYGNITASYNVATGVLTLTSAGSTATVAQWQAALSAVTYTDTSDAPNTATRTISFVASDGTDGSVAATKSVSVAPVNDAPVVTSSGGTTSATEQVATVVDGGITVSDVDNTTLASATVSITGNFHSGEDVLAFINDGSTMGNIAASYNAATGVLTLTSAGGTATLAQWQAALRAVTYTDTADAPNTATRTISFVANDGTDSSVAATKSVGVAAVNDAPIDTVPGAQALPQDGTLTFNNGNGNLISVSDADGGGGVEQVTLTVTHGTLTLSGTTGLSFLVGSGSADTTMTFTGALADINNALNGLVYQPTSGYHGSDSLQITANDLGNSGSGGAQTATSTVALDVQPPNPVVTDVSSTNADGTYKVGDTVTVTVTFDQAVTVDTSGGTPTLLLETGSVDRNATYVSGSGTNTLTFTYTVQAGDLSSDLDYQSTSALSLNGATITNATSDAAVLTLPALGGAQSLAGQKALVVDGVAPTIASVGVPADGTYAAGQNLDFTVNFSETVIVDTSGGTPRIAVTLDTGGTVYADYVSGSGTSALIFRLTVQSGELDTTGIALGGTLDAHGGSVRDTAGNDLVVGLNGVASTAGVDVDGIAPTVSAITRVDGNPTDAGSVTYTVTFSEDVTGVDASDFSLTATGTATGSVAGVTQVDAHTYTVTVNGVAGDGTLALDLKGSGTGIADLAGNAITGGLAGAAYTVDHTAPTITAVDVPPGGDYKAGEALTFTVHTSEAVTVDTSGGTPRLAITLDNGSVVYADYVTGSGTDALTFRYAVQAGDTDVDGIVLGTSLDPHGGSATDAAGNALAPALAGVASTTGVHIDTTAPTATAITRVDGNPTNAGSVTYTVTFSEDVSGVDVGDFALATTGSAHGQVASVKQVDAHTYTVVVTGVSGSGDLRLDLRSGGTGVVDAAGNALAGGFAGETYKVAGIAPVVLPTGTPPPAPVAPPLATVDPVLPSPHGDALPTLFFAPSAPPRDPFAAAPLGTSELDALATLPGAVGRDATPLDFVDLATPREVVLGADRSFSFALPWSAVIAGDRGTRVAVEVRMASGAPLPAWVVFDPVTGTLAGIAPRGFSGTLVLEVVARDAAGRQAVGRIDLLAADMHAPAKPAPHRADASASELPHAGRPALQAQFAHQRHGAGADAAALLRQLAAAQRHVTEAARGH